VSLHIHKGAQKDEGRWGTPFLATPRLITGASSPSKADLHKLRGAKTHNGRERTQITELEDGTSCSGPS